MVPDKGGLIVIEDSTVCGGCEHYSTVSTIYLRGPCRVCHRNTKRIKELKSRCKEREIKHEEIHKRLSQWEGDYYERREKSVCTTLKRHASDLKDDPERLSTEFMQNLIGIKYKEK